MTTEGPRLSDTDCAYLAGMIDQSGWIRVRRSGRGSKASRPLVLYIGKLNSEQAKWIRDRLGDRVTLEMGTPRWRADFVTPNDSAVVLALVSPFLLTFKEKAKLMFRYARTSCSPGGRLTPEQISERASIEADLALLRKRGA